MSDKGLEDFAIGAIIGVLLVKVPALRWVAALTAAFFGVVWFMATFVMLRLRTDMGAASGLYVQAAAYAHA